MMNVPPLLVWLTRQSVGRAGESWIYRNSLGSAEVHSGETVHVVLGGTGQTVIGHVLAPAGNGGPVDWAYSRVEMSVYTAPPENFAAMTNSEKLAWRQAWLKSEDGQAFVRNPRQYSTMIGDDGTFRFEDVATGTYRLNVTVNAPPKARYQIFGPPIGTVTRTITVVPVSNGDPDEPLDLGEIELQPQQ
jgi:hypothetical protein